MSSVLAPLPPEESAYELVAMLTPSHAVDLFLGDLARRSRSENGRTVASYRRLLDKFTDSLRPDQDVTDITPDDCRRFLDGYTRRSPGTQATTYSTLNSFLRWLYMQQRVRNNPLDRVPRPRRLNPADLDVTTVSNADVPRLLAACRSWTEKLAIAIPAYMGPRRAAVARLRLRDYNLDNDTIRFREKGGKTIDKPVPAELSRLLRSAIAAGAITRQDDYLVPPERAPIKKERDDRVIWRVVTRVADRAGVEAHVHALRAAFATFYLEEHTGDLEGLRELMGHESIQTTQVYLRKLDRRSAMERVRTLSWEAVAPTGNDLSADLTQIAMKAFASSELVGAGGFEPPSADSLDAATPIRLPSGQRGAK